jgi:hypothetical protein
VEEPEDEIPFEWHRRAAIALLREEPLAEVIEQLEAADVPEDLAASLCAGILTSPVFDAARWAMGQLAKLECVLDVRQQMADLGPRRFEVDRRKGLSRRVFLEEYYATNTPVVLEDLCEDWPARTLWSPEYLAEKLGDAEVEVMTGRHTGSGNEINLDQHRTLMAFDEYVAQVLATEWSNELYLVANNKLLSEKLAAPLWKEFSLDRRYLKADRNKSATFLWFGPGGTVTSLHHDVLNILFHQVRGWKHFILVSPMETPLVSNRIGVYSDVDPLAPDLEQFPKYARAHPLQVTVGPGDALFVPVGWWHHVTALETSISVSCTSFVFPNTLHWVHPVIEP